MTKGIPYVLHDFYFPATPAPVFKGSNSYLKLFEQLGFERGKTGTLLFKPVLETDLAKKSHEDGQWRKNDGQSKTFSIHFTNLPALSCGKRIHG